MAVDLTLKGTEITNREAIPRVLNNPGLGFGAIEKVAYGVLAAVPAALSATSIIRLLSVPSNAVITDLRFSSDIQTAGSVDIGVYRTNGDGGAVVSAAFFASAVGVTAASVNVDVLNESTTNTLVKQGQPLWKAAGMATDPKAMLDLALTVAVAVTTPTGSIALRARFTM